MQQGVELTRIIIGNTMKSIKYHFQKGTSGNPKGRPKVNDKSLSRAVLKDRLAAYKFVQQAMKNQEPWAYELYFKALLPVAREFVNDDK